MSTCIWTEFIGKTITEIQEVSIEDLRFEFSDGSRLRMYHEQDCCEEVFLAEVIGDLTDLYNSPVIMFEQVSEHSEDQWGDSSTWTFYKIATVKGYVTLRWLGTSNGYYSEKVNFEYFDGEETWSDFSLDCEEIDS